MNIPALQNVLTFEYKAGAGVGAGPASSHNASLRPLRQFISTLIVGLHGVQFKAVCRVILCSSLKIQKKASFSLCGLLWKVMTESFLSSKDLYKMSS